MMSVLSVSEVDSVGLLSSTFVDDIDRFIRCRLDFRVFTSASLPASDDLFCANHLAGGFDNSVSL